MIRFMLVAALTAILGIPLLVIRFTIAERVTYAELAGASIRETWGGDQLLIGPFLTIPFSYSQEYQEWVGNADQRQLQVRTRTMQDILYVFPKRLDVSAALSPSERIRGIFRTWVYRGEVSVQGHFGDDLLEGVTLPPGASVHRSQMKLIVLARDLRGVDRPVHMQEGAAFRATSSPFEGYQGMELPWPEGRSASFSFALPLQGSGGFEVAPVGTETSFRVESTWPDPSFIGHVLPSERTVSEAGFNATWRFSEFTHGLPRFWKASGEDSLFPLPRLAAKAAGVKLDPAVTPQRMAERAVKYGLLFVIFVLGLLYAMDAVGPSTLRIAHYFWVGLASCLFFMLLLALAEVIAFGAAYLVAATACVALIAVFTKGLFGSPLRSNILALGLCGVFAYLFVVLRMEDYALLAGTLALFVALGVAMKLTRRIVG